MASPQVQLPAGYQDASPVTMKLPPGFEDAAPAKAAAPQASEPSLYDRMSSRIKQNFDFGTQIKNVADQVSQAILDAKSGKAFAPGVHRLPEVLDVLKKTYGDPANVLGDIMTGLITHQATAEMPAARTAPPAPAEAIPPTEAPPVRTRPSVPSAEPDIEMQMRGAVDNPPTTQIQGVPDRLGTPEQIDRIRKSMETRDAAKKALETGGLEKQADADPYAAARKAAQPTPERGLDPAIRPSIERIIDEAIPANEQPVANFQAKAKANYHLSALEEQLNSALGGKKLAPGVPLKDQASAMQAPAAKLPEGFTPVDSSALNGYKYDPGAQTFESITKSGEHYVHGEVDPETAQSFVDAESKGLAWNRLRNAPGVTYLGKMRNGKLLPAQPPSALRTSMRIDEPPQGTTVPTEDNQMGLLQKMLEDALAKKGR
jgi:hypothetical protein